MVFFVDKLEMGVLLWETVWSLDEKRSCGDSIFCIVIPAFFQRLVFQYQT